MSTEDIVEIFKGIENRLDHSPILSHQTLYQLIRFLSFGIFPSVRNYVIHNFLMIAQVFEVL